MWATVYSEGPGLCVVKDMNDSRAPRFLYIVRATSFTNPTMPKAPDIGGSPTHPLSLFPLFCSVISVVQNALSAFWYALHADIRARGVRGM